MTSSFIAFQLIRIIVLGVIASLTAVLLTPLWSYVLYKYRLGKHIREDKNAPVFMSLHKKKEGTPTMGGVLIWGTILLLVFIFYFFSQWFDGFWGELNFLSRSQTWLPLAAMAGAAVVGLIDDLLGIFRIGPKGGGLRIRDKIIIYTLIAIIGAWWFWVKLGFDTVHFPLIGEMHFGLFYPIFFVFILVSSAFSMNETDGLDGLAAGVSLISFACLLIVAFVSGKYDMAAFLATLLGTLIAFLWFNVYPARFFMGDTGSMALGITLGVVAMLTDTALFLPLFAFILVIESLSVIIQMIYKRWRKKKLFLSTPIHHHFEALGWPETKVTIRFWLISGIMAALGLALYFLDVFLV